MGSFGGFYVNPTVDLYKYRSLERAGMRAFETRDDENAVRIFNDALALWRGRALADVELGTGTMIGTARCRAVGAGDVSVS